MICMSEYVIDREFKSLLLWKYYITPLGVEIDDF